MRKIEAQLMYYLHWTPAAIKALSEQDLAEAWANLCWVRNEEAKAQEEANKKWKK